MEKYPETNPESDRNDGNKQVPKGETRKDQEDEEEAWVERTQRPDDMTIGKFAFHIKHGVPQEHRDELWKLWDIDVDKFTYEDIPEHLRVYEFTPEEYAELEKEETQPITNWGTYNWDEDNDEDEECLPVKP